MEVPQVLLCFISTTEPVYTICTKCIKKAGRLKQIICSLLDLPLIFIWKKKDSIRG